MLCSYQVTNLAPKLIVAGTVLVCAWLFLTIPACVRYEKQMVHRDAWVPFIPVYNGNTFTQVPIFHPETDALEDVCVEREKK